MRGRERDRYNIYTIYIKREINRERVEWYGVEK